MTKKNIGIKFNTIRGDSLTFYLHSDKIDSKSLLKSIFNEEEITQIEKHFNQFYRLIQKHCHNSKLKSLLKKVKPGIRLSYYTAMYEEIAFTSLYARLLKDDIPEKDKQELRAKVILSARIKLFFFADVVIAFALGDNKKLLNLQEELNKLRNVRRTYDLELLKKIKEIEMNGKNEIPKPKQIECVILANKALKEKFFKNSDLVDESGFYTQTAYSIRDAYKSQKKSL